MFEKIPNAFHSVRIWNERIYKTWYYIAQWICTDSKSAPVLLIGDTTHVKAACRTEIAVHLMLLSDCPKFLENTKEQLPSEQG